MELQPRDSGGGDGHGAEALSPMAIAEALCNDICDVVRDIKFPVEDIQRSLSDEEKGPYQFVFLQECTYMGALTGEMLRSLLELQLGFKGELTMSAPMEALMNSLYMEKIPPYWAKLAFPSRETACRVCGSSSKWEQSRWDQLGPWVSKETYYGSF